jgi:hypothetical protein
MTDKGIHFIEQICLFLDKSLSRAEEQLFWKQINENAAYADMLKREQTFRDALKKHYNPPPTSTHTLQALQANILKISKQQRKRAK